MSHRFGSLLVALAWLSHLSVASVVGGTTEGDLRLRGLLESQQLVRHPRVDELSFIQQRNTLRLLAEWRWLSSIRSLRGDDFLGFLDDAGLFLQYRGVYDSVYSYTPHVRTTRDYRGERVPADLDELEDLDAETRRALGFENDLREAYVDVAGPCWKARLGRQQIVWGVSDGFRVLDRINSLDLSWHSFQDLPATDESFDDIRIPFWMLDVRVEPRGDGVLGRSFAELYWNPGDWRPNEIGFLPRPWGVQSGSPGGLLESAGLLDEIEIPGKLFRQGSYSRNPEENSQVGVRIGLDRGRCRAPTDCPASGQLVFMRQRFTPWGGASTSAAQLFSDRDRARRAAAFTFEAPYLYTVGLSWSVLSCPHDPFRSHPWKPCERAPLYPTGRRFWTYALRHEAAIDFGVPFYQCPGGAGSVAGRDACTRDFFIGRARMPRTADHTVWSNLVGLDVTWYAPFRHALSVQLFSTYVIDRRRDTVGSLDLPTLRDTGGAFRDDVRRWEAASTVSAAAWLLNGTLRPALMYLVDPINGFSQEIAWSVRYQATADLAVELAQRFLIDPKHDVNFEPWGLGGLNRGRSETGLRFVYEFASVPSSRRAFSP